MIDYLEIAGDVSDLIDEFGQTANAQPPAENTASPTDPNPPAATEPDPFEIAIAVFPIETDRVDGRNILAGDYRVIAEAKELTIDHKIICSEGTLRIADLGAIAPAGVVVAYDMVCRK